MTDRMSSKTMDELVEEAGSFGRFQLILIILTRVSVPMVTWNMLFMVFGSLEPDWWCVSHDLHNVSEVHFLNNSFSDALSTAVPDFATDLTTPTGAWRGEHSFNKENDLPFANSSKKYCGTPDGSNEVCERIVFAPGMNTIVSQFQLVCGLSWVPSLIISLQMVGVLIGAFLAGIVADGIGRKKTIASITALHAVFSIISAFSVSWQMFAAMRTLIGLAIGGTVATLHSYPTEFIGIKWRTVIRSVPIWGIGSMIYSLLLWALPDWSYQHIVTAVCSAACLPAWLFLPESVRWLSVKGRMAEAHAVLVKIAKWNRRTPPSLQSMQELCVESKESEKKYHYFHLFSSWQLVKLSVLFGWMWFSSSLNYYGLSFGIKNMSGNFYTNFTLMAVFEVWPPLFVYPVANFFGRRWATFGSLLLTTLGTLSVVPISLLMPAEEGGTYINALCLGARASLSFGWSVMAVFTAEQYPTVVRGIALGYGNTIARLGGILAPYILSLGEPYVFYIIITAVMAISCLTPILMHEAKGRPLSDELPPTFWKKKTVRIHEDEKHGV